MGLVHRAESSGALSDRGGAGEALLLLAWTVLEKPGFRDFKDGPSQHQVVPAEESWRADAESHHVRALSPYVVPSGA